MGFGSDFLSDEERASTIAAMRENSHVGIDYWLLIFLSSGIAFCGLVQNSSAVIIGAMLVAPLMGPILATGFNIVTGNLRQLVSSALSTIGGISVAIGVSAGATMLLPVKTITPEILARTQPTLLDLVVALLSGLAGAYAMCRKNVSASLPGVAIAAALVPPLCVVGFGLGSQHLEIAGRAGLLFVTNLACIVFAMILVSWLLRFRANTAGGTIVATASFPLAVAGVMLVSLPLSGFTVSQILKSKRMSAVTQVLQNELDPSHIEIEDIVIHPTADGFIVGMTVFLYKQDLLESVIDQTENVEHIRNELETAVGGPVTVKARVIVATSTTLERPGLPSEKLELKAAKPAS